VIPTQKRHVLRGRVVFPLSIRVPVHIRRTLRVSEVFLPFTGGSGERIDFAANPQSSADVNGYTDRKRKNRGIREEHAFLKTKHHNLLETRDTPW
jgi:hypothetical protein